MNWFERFLYFLQGEMETPKIFGWFHILCVLLTLLIIFILSRFRDVYNERQLRIVTGIFAIVALILEILKQFIWAFNYDEVTNVVTWDYEWYAFPFQLCTTPIFICLICLFMNKSKLRDNLYAYLSFTTILGSIATIIYPETCFVSDILVNIHTMWLHLGGFVIAVYLLMMGEVKINKDNIIGALKVFYVFVLLALVLNIIIYQSGILNDETFNMFYISPYFISSIPVFDIIQESVPYIVYLFIYLLALSLGSFIIFYIAKFISNRYKSVL